MNENNELYGDRINNYSKGNEWIWNDVLNDIISIVPYFSGKIGYIVEYE